MILPSSSTLSCSPSTHVWLNSSVCLEQKIQGKIKELSQMTLVSCMNTNFQSKKDSARCGVTDFGGKMPWRSCFFYDNVVAAKVCSRSCNPLPQKYERERETRTCERGIHHTVLPDVLLSQTQVASGSFDHGHAVEMIMKQ